MMDKFYSKMPELTDEILINNLKRNEKSSFELLYKFYFTSMAHYIKQNSGNNKDAEDIFQETIIILLNKIRQPEFILTSSLKTYLFSISKNLWLKKIRSNKNFNQNEYITKIHVQSNDEDSIGDNNEEKIISWLEKITANCQRILKALFYLNEPLDSLMIKMGWKNKHTASNQKYKCIEQLRKESKK